MTERNKHDSPTRDMIRLSLSVDEMLVLFELLENIDNHSLTIARVFDRLKVMHFKHTNGMRVSSYKVRAAPKPRKHSMDGLGFGNSVSGVDVVQESLEIAIPAYGTPAYEEWASKKYAEAEKIAETNKPFSLKEWKEQQVIEQLKIQQDNKEGKDMQ